MVGYEIGMRKVYQATTIDLQYSYYDSMISVIRGFLSTLGCSSLMTRNRSSAYNISTISTNFSDSDNVRSANLSSSGRLSNTNYITSKENSTLANGDAPSEKDESQEPDTKLTGAISEVMEAGSLRSGKGY